MNVRLGVVEMAGDCTGRFFTAVPPSLAYTCSGTVPEKS